MIYTCSNCGVVRNTFHKKKTTLCRICQVKSRSTKVVLNCKNCGKSRTYKASHSVKRVTKLCKTCYEAFRGKTQQIPCIDCGKLRKYKTSEILAKGYRRCKKCYLVYQRGPNAPNWKGGLVPLFQLIRTSTKYIAWRNVIMVRDDFTCKICSKRGGDLQVDHFPNMFADLIRVNQLKSLDKALQCAPLWDINQNRTLCRPCHKDVHIKGRLR